MKIGNPGAATRAGTKKTALFDIVNRKRRGAMHRQGAGAPSRQRQRARAPAERAPRRVLSVPLTIVAAGSEDRRIGGTWRQETAATLVQHGAQLSGLSAAPGGGKRPHRA